MDATWGCWDTGDTAGPWVLPWRKWHLGSVEKGREGTRGRQGRVCARSGQCLGWLELGGGSLPEGQDGARQQRAPVRKPGRGSVIPGVLPFSIPGPSLGLFRNRVFGAVLLQAASPRWAGSDVGVVVCRACLVFRPLFSV